MKTANYDLMRLLGLTTIDMTAEHEGDALRRLNALRPRRRCWDDDHRVQVRLRPTVTIKQIAGAA